MPDFYEIDFRQVHTAKSGDAIGIRYQIGQNCFVHLVDGGYASTAPELAKFHPRYIQNEYRRQRRGHASRPGPCRRLEIRAIAREYGPAAIKRLGGLAGLREGIAPPQAEQAQIAALKELLDRGYGRPVQPLGSNPEIGIPLMRDLATVNTILEQQIECAAGEHLPAILGAVGLDSLLAPDPFAVQLISQGMNRFQREMQIQRRDDRPRVHIDTSRRYFDLRDMLDSGKLLVAFGRLISSD